MFSDDETYTTLGGEGCPAADIATPAQNRNNFAVAAAGDHGLHAGSGRTGQERTGAADTRATRKSKFAFTMHSRTRADKWETEMGIKNSAKVLVCGECLRASCWYGEFMCDAAVSAGLKILTVGDLRRLDRESSDYWTDEKMIIIYGDASRDFRV